MASGATDAFLTGLIGGFTPQFDQRIGMGQGNDQYQNQMNAGAVANSQASTPEEASGEGYGTQYYGGPGRSASGTRYGIPNNGFMAQMLENVSHSALNYIQTGDIGQASAAGAQAVQNLNNKHWRAGEAEKLESQGFNPVDIQQWVNDGNPKSLTANLGNRMVDGRLMTAEQYDKYSQRQEEHRHNVATENTQNYGAQTNRMNAQTNAAGEQRQEANYNRENKQIDHEVDLGNRKLIVYKDGSQEYKATGISPGTADNKGGVNINLKSGQGLSYNKDVGTYGYETTLPDGRTAFVHTSSKGTETKSGKNMVYTVKNDDGTWGATETGQMTGQGQDPRLASVVRTSQDALGTGSQIAGMDYGTDTGRIAGPGSESSNKFWNQFSGHRGEAQNLYDIRNKQMGSILSDRAVMSSNNSILKSDMDQQVQASGQLNVKNTPDANQRIFNLQNRIILGAQIDSAYRNAHGGKSMPPDQYEAELYKKLNEHYREHPEELNAFGQTHKIFGQGKTMSLTDTVGKPPEGVSSSQATGGDLGAASAPEGTVHTNQSGVKAKVVNGRWVRQN